MSKIVGTQTESKSHEYVLSQLQNKANILVSSFLYTFSELATNSEVPSYRDEIRRMREEDPAFFRQLVTGDIR